MARADDFLRLVDDPEAEPPVVGEHPADDTLLSILVHMACSDGLVQEEEFAFLHKVLPDRDETDILLWVSEQAGRPIDWDQARVVLSLPAEARAALRFAARLAWADRVLDTQEKALLRTLSDALNLGDNELETALDEVVGQPSGAAVPEASIIEAFQGMAWRAISTDDGGLFSDLVEVVPAEAKPVARLLIEGIEQVGLYDLGIAAKFIEGPRFVPWSEVALYTRVPVLGATLRVMTMDGRTLTVADPRLQEVGTLLDRVYAAQAAETPQ